jgi:glycosyltransferase involved in cell wall biosynthesis
MKSGAFLTVCVPTYNRPDAYSMLTSLSKAQNSLPFLLLISDNASNDPSCVAHRENFARNCCNHKTSLIIQEKNLGYSGNIIALVNAAKSSWLTFMMDDDNYTPEGLARMIDNIKNTNSVDLYFNKGKPVASKSSSGLKQMSIRFVALIKLSYSNLLRFLFFKGSSSLVVIKPSRLLAFWKRLIFLPFDPLPNSITVRTEIIQSVIKDPRFILVYERIANTGHALDFVLLALCAEKAKYVGLEFNPTYEHVKHSSNGQLSIKSNPKYHASIDSFINKNLFLRPFLSRNIFILFNYMRLYFLNAASKLFNFQ